MRIKDIITGDLTESKKKRKRFKYPAFVGYGGPSGSGTDGGVGSDGTSGGVAETLRKVSSDPLTDKKIVGKAGTEPGSEVNEDLKKWFDQKWVRFGPDGKIRGDCARDSDSEGKPKCLPQSKAHALGKKGRASAAARKRRQDPKANRRGKAKNVSTKTESFTNIPFDQCPHCGNEIVHIDEAAGKKDACYHKVRSRYKVWPSAYASGALVQCRKKGAKNWGNKSAQNEEVEIDEKWSQKYKNSINCNNPRGFSQKAHCQGRKKHAKESQEMFLPDDYILDESWSDVKKFATGFGGHIKSALNKFKQKFLSEVDEASLMFRVYAREARGLTVTEKERKAANAEFLDFLKLMGLGALYTVLYQAFTSMHLPSPVAATAGLLPALSVKSLLSLLVDYAHREHNFNILPSSFSPQTGIEKLTPDQLRAELERRKQEKRRAAKQAKNMRRKR
jgi:hypothetical protein